MGWCKLSLCVLAVLVVAKTQAGKVICYYDGESFFRDGTAKVSSLDVAPALHYCNQLNYGYFGIGKDKFDIETLGKQDSDKGKVHIRQITDLKRTTPNLKIVLVIGGPPEAENYETYLKVLEKANRRTDFANSVVKKVNDYQFDGVDLAWQFPFDKDPKDRGIFGSLWHGAKKTFTGDRDPNPAAHREQFTSLARELKALLRPKGHTLSVSALPHVNLTTYFDVASLNSVVDQYIVHTYNQQAPDRNGELADHAAPLHFLPGRIPHQNVEALAQQWIQKGATPDKLIISVPTFGRSWKMTDDSGKTGNPPVKVDGPGRGGTYVKKDGYYAYFETCPQLGAANAKADGILLKKVSDPSKRVGPYAYRLPGKEKGIWLSYEDPESAGAKAQFARNKYGGVAVVDLSMDDFKGMCDGSPYPILRAVKNNLG